MGREGGRKERGYKYWTLDMTHHHSLSLSSLLQRWKLILRPLQAVATQAQIVVPRALVAQKLSSAAQVKFAAQQRRITCVRGERSAAARQTAASNKNVRIAPAVGKEWLAVNKSIDCDIFLLLSGQSRIQHIL